MRAWLKRKNPNFKTLVLNASISAAPDNSCGYNSRVFPQDRHETRALTSKSSATRNNEERSGRICLAQSASWRSRFQFGSPGSPKVRSQSLVSGRVGRRGSGIRWNRRARARPWQACPREALKSHVRHWRRAPRDRRARRIDAFASAPFLSSLERAAPIRLGGDARREWPLEPEIVLQSRRQRSRPWTRW
jgi:hypothetical protein